MDTIKVYNRTGKQIILKDYYPRNSVRMEGFFGCLIYRIPARGDMSIDLFKYVDECLKLGGHQEIHISIDGNTPANPPPLELKHETFIINKEVFFGMSGDGRRLTHTFSKADEETDILPV